MFQKYHTAAAPIRKSGQDLRDSFQSVPDGQQLSTCGVNAVHMSASTRAGSHPRLTRHQAIARTAGTANKGARATGAALNHLTFVNDTDPITYMALPGTLRGSRSILIGRAPRSVPTRRCSNSWAIVPVRFNREKRAIFALSLFITRARIPVGRRYSMGAQSPKRTVRGCQKFCV